MRALFLAAILAPGPALAQSIIFQEDVTGGGCGCTSGGRASVAWLLLLPALVSRRRKLRT